MSTEAAVHLGGGLADRSAWTARDHCSIEKALGVVGTRSAMLLMREAHYGTRRFDDFARRVGISGAVAAARLRELVAAGLLVRVPYREAGQRTRQEYLLTEMGRDLLPATLALMRWGDKYLTTESGPPLNLTHTACGADVDVEIRCQAGHHVPPGELAARPRLEPTRR